MSFPVGKGPPETDCVWCTSQLFKLWIIGACFGLGLYFSLNPLPSSLCFFPLVLVVFCFPWLLFQKGMANGLQIKSLCPRDIKNSFLRKEIERVELDSTLMRATWKWI